MEVVRTLFIILEAACSLALIGLILLQKSKSEGLGVAFGGGGSDSLLGARAGNVLTRATVIIGIIFLLNTVLLGWMYAGSADQSLIDSANIPDAPVAPLQQPADMPLIPETPVAPVAE